MTYEQLLEQGRYIKTIYDASFVGVESEILNLEKFKLNFHIDCEEMLTQTHKKVYQQRKVLKEIEKIYPQEKQLNLLEDRLKDVSKQIFKILKNEFHYIDCWVNDEGNIEYAIAP